MSIRRGENFLARMHFESHAEEFEADEYSIFTDVSGLEEQIYLGSRTHVYGEVVLRFNGKNIKCKKRGRKAVELPRWIEPDHVTVKECSAKGVLLIEHYSVFKKIIECPHVHQLPLILITGFGIPRFATRRFLHLLNKTQGTPVYILADNDPWGYFIFSLLKRGTLDPSDHFPFAAINDTRFLGLRSGDLLCQEAAFKWKPHWAVQMKALKEYTCFSSKPWQFELSQFEKQKFKIETSPICRAIGANALVKFIINRFDKNEYLK